MNTWGGKRKGAGGPKMDRDHRPHARGEACRHAKLTEAQVREIRREYDTGRWSHRRLAARYGVSQTAIAQIVTYASWIHVR